MIDGGVARLALDLIWRYGPQRKGWVPEPESAAELRTRLSIHAWTQLDIPPPDRLLGDLLTTTSRMFLIGRTGLGKTLLGISLATGIASGTGFLHWRSHRPARVLYVDGEMPEELIKSRCIDALRRLDATIPPDNLMIYGQDSADRFADLGVMPPLNTEEGQKWLLGLIDAIGGTDCVIFDNVMSLLVGDQKDEETWTRSCRSSCN